MKTFLRWLLFLLIAYLMVTYSHRGLTWVYPRVAWWGVVLVLIGGVPIVGLATFLNVLQSPKPYKAGLNLGAVLLALIVLSFFGDGFTRGLFLSHLAVSLTMIHGAYMGATATAEEILAVGT